MVLEPGSHIFVVHRRLYKDDHSRFFMGKVDNFEDSIIRVTGHSWVQDPFTGKIAKKENGSTKILSLSSGTLLIYVLPPQSVLSSIQIEHTKDNRTFVTDGKEILLDLTESFHRKTA
jgi:hypothetical protein